VSYRTTTRLKSFAQFSDILIKERLVWRSSAKTQIGVAGDSVQIVVGGSITSSMVSGQRLASGETDDVHLGGAYTTREHGR